MSEPNSLFAKIHISKENYDAFLKSNPQSSTLDKNWLDWWESKEMYGKMELTQTYIYCYEDPTNEAIVNGWLNAKQSFTFSDYDAINEIWHFGIILFSENYLEMIPMLVFFKSLAPYIKNDDSFVVVYNFFWGGNEVNAYLTYKEKEGWLDKTVQTKLDIDAKQLEYANEYLAKKLEGFSNDESMID
jgi:hypothetical protein